MPWLFIAAAVAIGYYVTKSSVVSGPLGWLETPNPPKDTSGCFPCGPWRYQSAKGQLWYVYLVVNEWGATKEPVGPDTKDADLKVALRAPTSKDLVAKMEA
jgi:hypothetical protein